MNLQSKKTVLAVLLSLAVGSAAAVTGDGGEVTMSLDEIYRLADQESKSLKIYSMLVEEAQHNLQAARAARLPQLDANLSVTLLGDGWVIDRDFGNAFVADIPHFGNNFALVASQVVYSGGALSSSVEMAKIAGEMAREQQRGNRNDLRFMLAGYYIEMYKMDNHLRVYDENIALTRQLIADTEARYREGTVLQSDVTRYELQLENLKLARLKIENTRRILNERLNKVIGLGEGTCIKIDTTFLQKELSLQSEADWRSSAAAGSHIIALGEKGVAMAQQKERITRAERLPQVAVVAEEHLDGPITIEIPAIDKNFNYWFVGLGVRYNIASLYKSKSKLGAARAERLRSEAELALQHDELESRVHADYLHYAEAQEEMVSRLKSVKLAQQNYDTMNRRYVAQLALATDMIEVSNARLDAQLQLANASAGLFYCACKLQHTAGSL